MTPAAVSLTDLRTEYLTEPMAVTGERPRFSWIVESKARAVSITGYQVIVASSKEAIAQHRPDVWDSGRVHDERCVHIEYAGRELAPAQRYWWAARVWDRNDDVSEWSASWFETALAAGMFQAAWIALPAAPFERDDFRPAQLLRREFEAHGRPKAARLYATALGLYELYVNGERIGKAKFRPGWTDYETRVQYQVYDLTDEIVEGKNAVGFVLGEGWFAGHWLNSRALWGDRPAAAAQLLLAYEDGSSQLIATDSTWRGSFGPILRSDLLLGEIYDARQEQPGWAGLSFDDHEWLQATVLPQPSVQVVAERATSPRVTRELAPVSITAPEYGVYVFDLGQNIVGWTRLRVTAPRGTEIVVRHGEMLGDDGKVYTANLKRAAQTDRYICKGDGEEVYEPTFTYHGFRYAEVANLAEEPTDRSVTGIVVHNGMRAAGAFHCSAPLVNRLQENIVWTQRGNFLEVPTDCPQRNERLPWLGSARPFATTACFNYDVAALYTKWLDDIAIARTADGFYADYAPYRSFIQEIHEGAPGWADAGVFLPWLMYEQYEDVRILREHYPAMATFVDAVHAANPSLIRRERVGNNYGDWLSVPEEGRADGLLFADIYSTTPRDLVATAFFKRSADLVANAARVLELEDDVKRFSAIAEAVRCAFCREFVAPDGKVLGDTQTGYVLALEFELLPEELRSAAGAWLVAALDRRQGRLSTGIIGTELLLPALASIGRRDLAVRLLLETNYPSWGYWIRHGATTVWERWDGWTAERGFQNPLMNSFNHCEFGAVGAWLYSAIGAIELLEPGYRRVRIRPAGGQLISSGAATHRSIRGIISTAWSAGNDNFSLAVKVPTGCVAVVHVPCGLEAVVYEGTQRADKAEGVRLVDAGAQERIYEVRAGTYEFRTSPEQATASYLELP